jgi:hypothetical protein
MVRRAVVLVMAAMVMLAVPSVASAGKVKLGGGVAGAPASKVQITVTKKHGNLGKITKLKFNRVPITCADGLNTAINGRTVRSFRVSGNKFTKRTRIAGPGIKNGFFRASGKFRRGGKVAKGFVRFSVKRTDGVGCGTDTQRWKARK